MTRCRIGGREVELNIEKRLRGTRRQPATGQTAAPGESAGQAGDTGRRPASPLVISFFVEGLPQTKGSAKGFVGKSKKTGKLRAFITNDNAKNKGWARYVASQARLHARSVPMGGPVYLELSFYLPRAKKPKHPVFPIVRPDLDKMTRSICDALKDANVYLDDSQVCASTQCKVYAIDRPGVHILVREHL